MVDQGARCLKRLKYSICAKDMKTSYSFTSILRKRRDFIWSLRKCKEVRVNIWHNQITKLGPTNSLYLQMQNIKTTNAKHQKLVHMYNVFSVEKIFKQIAFGTLHFSIISVECLGNLFCVYVGLCSVP